MQLLSFSVFLILFGCLHNNRATKPGYAHQALADPETDNGQNYEYHYQNNGELKQCPLQTPSRAKDGIRLAKDTPQTTTLDLKQDDHDYRY